jgi:hypothetical protein
MSCLEACAHRDPQIACLQGIEEKFHGPPVPSGTGAVLDLLQKRLPQPCGCGGPKDDLELARLLLESQVRHPRPGRCVRVRRFRQLRPPLIRHLPPTKVIFDEDRIRILVSKNLASGIRGSGFGVLPPREDGPEPVAMRTFGPRRSAVPSAQPAILANQLESIIPNRVA